MQSERISKAPAQKVGISEGHVHTGAVFPPAASHNYLFFLTTSGLFENFFKKVIVAIIL